MLFAALVAFVGTLVAFAGVTALLRGWLDLRKGYILACSFVLLCLSVGLGAATIGLVLEFRPSLFRAYEVGVSLLAMIWLAEGVVELVARSLRVRFAVRLLAVSLSIVAGVILSVDPLREAGQASALPAGGDLYMPLPLILLAAAHAAVVLVVSACFFTVAMRAWRGEEETGELFLSCLLILLAVILVFVAARPELVALPPVVAMALIIGAAVLVWIAPVRAMRLADEDDEEGRTLPPEPPPERVTGRRRRVEPVERSHEQDRPTVSTPPPDIPESHAIAAQHREGRRPFADQTTTRLAGHAGSPPASGSMDDACGFIVIFTLREGAARTFDRLVESTVEAIGDKEPGTLIYACHAVADAPQQRIFYELYRDRDSMQDHERQPHVRRFIAEREQYVLATNVVRLKLNSSTGLPEPQLA